MAVDRTFISWQPVLTDHQAFTFQALAQESGVPVVSYVTSLEDKERKAQGWTDTQVISLERRLIPKRGFLGYCYRQLREHRADIHLFASPFQHPKLMLCMLFAVWFDVEFYLISEPYSPKSDGYFSDAAKVLGEIKARLRPLLYRVYALLLRTRVAGIFAISSLALTQYRQVGVPSTKLFPFGYFIPRDPSVVTNSLEHDDSSGLRIIFVGSMIRRKGLDLLHDAVQQLCVQGKKLSVDVYGPGDATSVMFNSERIRYCGTIPFGRSQQVMAQYDLLVLPSRYDGWGVVVNEALCAGIPVVCSDTVGAAAAAVFGNAGLCFSSGNARDLADVLARIVNDPLLLKKMRTAAPFVANELQPSVAARYMLAVIQAPIDYKTSIRAPWYQDIQ